MKMGNLQNIFEMLMKTAANKASSDAQMFDEKDDGFIPNPKKSNPFAPQNGQIEEEIKSPMINGEDMFCMMDPSERSRAETFYENMRIEKENSLCRFCDKVILQEEFAENKVTMLQSSDCFHQVHIDCLVEEAVKAMSLNQQVKCPRCDMAI
jgi:phage FluMu protein Com